MIHTASVSMSDLVDSWIQLGLIWVCTTVGTTLLTRSLKHTHTHIYTYRHTHIQTHTHTHTYRHTHIQTHTHRHTHEHTHTHTHTQDKAEEYDIRVVLVSWGTGAT